jgi:hypothetical protein
MAALTHGETIAHAVPLAAAVLVVTDRGEAEARAGDYLIVTDQGRQITMTADEYRTATGAAESPAPGIPEAESQPAPVKRRPEVPAVVGSLLRRRTRPAPPPPPAQVLEAPPEVVTEPPDPVVNYTPIPRGSTGDFFQDLAQCATIDLSPQAPAVRPPPPSREGKKEYNPLQDLENLVIPKRPEGSFRKFMRPGPAPAPKKKKAKRPAVLPFQKKAAAKAAAAPKKQRYRYVEPEWT